MPARRPPVAVDEVAERIRGLASSGRSLREIALTAGVGRTTVAGIANGSVRRVSPDTFERLLASLEAA